MIQLGTQQNPEVWWCGKSSGSHLQPQTIWKRRKLRFLLVSFLSKTTLLTSSSWKTLDNYCMNSGPSGSEFTFDGPKTGLPWKKRLFLQGRRVAMLQPATPGARVHCPVRHRHESSRVKHMARLTQMPSFNLLVRKNPDVTILAPASYLFSPSEFNGCSKELGNPNVWKHPCSCLWLMLNVWYGDLVERHWNWGLVTVIWRQAMV